MVTYGLLTILVKESPLSTVCGRKTPTLDFSYEYIIFWIVGLFELSTCHLYQSSIFHLLFFFHITNLWFPCFICINFLTVYRTISMWNKLFWNKEQSGRVWNNTLQCMHAMFLGIISYSKHYILHVKVNSVISKKQCLLPHDTLACSDRINTSILYALSQMSVL